MPLAIEASELHAGLQATLVPPVLYSGRFVEACGETIPKESLGGDLADLILDGQNVIAYVMDVSGHGLRAGVLMGMAKAAFRYGLLLGQPLETLFHDINSLLGSIKERNMYLTLAALRFSVRNTVQYLSAGHVPVLQYRHRTGCVVRHSLSQFPLGLFPDSQYVSQRLVCEAGDVFALVTDGVVEMGEDPDAHRGLERLAGILKNLSGRPMSDLVTSMLAAATESGAQQDDATVLLVRCCEDPVEDEISVDQVDPVQIRREAWLKLLNELAEELASDE